MNKNILPLIFLLHLFLINKIAVSQKADTSKNKFFLKVNKATVFAEIGLTGFGGVKFTTHGADIVKYGYIPESFYPFWGITLIYKKNLVGFYTIRHTEESLNCPSNDCYEPANITEFGLLYGRWFNFKKFMIGASTGISLNKNKLRTAYNPKELGAHYEYYYYEYHYNVGIPLHVDIIYRFCKYAGIGIKVFSNWNLYRRAQGVNVCFKIGKIK